MGMTQQFFVFLSLVTLTLTFELGRDFCTVRLTAKFHHTTFSRSEVIVQTNTLTNKQTPLKTSTSFCYTPPKKGHSPQFSAHICGGQTAGWIKMPLGTEVGLDPGDIVLDGGASSSPLKRSTAPATFRPMSIVAKRSTISVTAEHLIVYDISWEPLNWFVRNSHGRRVWSLTRMNMKVKARGQRSRSPEAKTAFSALWSGAFYVW